MVAMVDPFTMKATDCTPTLSPALATRCIVPPGPARGGAVSVTVGFSVSGCATIVSVFSAKPVLPAPSRAVARTTIVSPGAATVGTSTTR